MVPFSIATQLVPIEAGVYRVQFTEDWYQARGAYGGLQFALLAAAMERAAGPDRPLRSFSAECCTPALAGEAILRVLPLRAGRQITQLAAEILQDGQCVTFATATLGVSRPPLYDFEAAAPPEVGEGLELPTGTLPPAFTQHFHFQFCHGEPPMSAALEAETGCRVRFRDAPERWSGPAVLGLVDAIWPAILATMTSMPVMGTVSFQAHLRGDYEDVATDPSRPALLVARSPITLGGFSSQDNLLWSADGKLLCRAMQQVAIIR